MSYKDLKSYQAATIIYDLTVEFCNRYMTYPTNKSYRTYDQMVQAARSGKQNIVEASSQRASKKSEIKLLGVARASLEELLEDYQDFLRQRGLPLWEKDSPKAREIRGLAYQTNRTDRTNRTYQTYLSDPEGAANTTICLINQANYLLDRQIKVLEEKFILEGGYSENLLKRRLAQRAKSDQWD